MSPSSLNCLTARETDGRWAKAYVLAVWHAAGVDASYGLGPLIEMAEELGDHLLDGEMTRG